MNSPNDPVHRFDTLPSMKEAVDEFSTFIRSIDDWTMERQVELTAIPAPPFGEGPRGARMAQLFQEVGLTSVSVDGVGNVLAWYGAEGKTEGAPDRPAIVSAHLDTVFPSDTDVTPRRNGDRIEAPGITDDGRGLAALLGLARTLAEFQPKLSAPLLFVATVGEEGPGDLRGVRHLFDSGSIHPAPRGFISLDGVGLSRIINRGVGSTRLRISVGGPGGHSWTDFGRTNPIHLLGRVVARAQALSLSKNPKTTLTVARWGGGHSINALPQEAWVELDLRSESSEKLLALEETLLAIVDNEVEGEGGKEGATLEIKEIGRRPAGSTNSEDALVLAAMEATRSLGQEAKLMGSSTDANYPMSLGIPAITMGAGGRGGGIHTLDEWYENEKGPEGILRALLTLLIFLEEEK